MELSVCTATTERELKSDVTIVADGGRIRTFPIDGEVDLFVTYLGLVLILRVFVHRDLAVQPEVVCGLEALGRGCESGRADIMHKVSARYVLTEERSLTGLRPEC